MFSAADHEFLVPYDSDFHIADRTSIIASDAGSKSLKKALKKTVADIADLQEVLYAEDQFSLLLVFQAMDAAGKDSTIRSILSGVNPAGCQVYSFKQPSSEELDHDFLWRTSRSLPERGRIGVFNRSYYEEVLVVRVHPEYLSGQKLPWQPDLETLWQQRFESIVDHEKHLARNGTIILKFWLNVSREEQHRRFKSRLDETHKNWKFSDSDLSESKLWDKYMAAYEALLNQTSKPWAPWYAIPADDKPAMRLAVANIVRSTLASLDMQYPKVDIDIDELRSQLIV